MGRHADPDSGAFWRSLGASAARALAVIAVGVAVAIGIVSVTGGEDPAEVAADSDAAETSTAGVDPDAVASASAVPLPPDPARAEPDPTPAEPTQPPETDETDETPEESATEGPLAEPVAAAPPPAETTVQVLDGVGGDGRQAQAAAQVLRDLGYDVVVINPAGTDHSSTEVQFSPGNDAAAEALAARDPRFTAAGPTTALSDAVDLHVIVGSDFTG